MGPTWEPSGADSTQVGPMLAPWTLLSGMFNSLGLSDTYICVSKLTSIGSDTDLLPGWCQAIILTNAGILFVGPMETNFSEIIIKIYTFSFKKIHLKMSSGKCWPFCLSLNVSKVANDLCSYTQQSLIDIPIYTRIYLFHYVSSSVFDCY